MDRARASSTRSSASSRRSSGIWRGRAARSRGRSRSSTRSRRPASRRSTSSTSSSRATSPGSRSRPSPRATRPSAATGSSTLRRAGRDRAPPADPALPPPLAAGRPGCVPRRSLGAVDPTERELLLRTAGRAADFLETLGERSIREDATVEELREALGGPLPDGPTEPGEVVGALADAAEPGVVGIPSGRYFGFVIGGGLPAAVAADWLTTIWDQNAGLYVAGPSAAVVRGGRRRMARRPARPAGRRRRRVRHGLSDGARHRAPGRAAPRACARGLGRERGRPSGRAAAPDRRGRGAAHDARPRAPLHRDRRARRSQLADADGEGRMDPEALRRVLRAGRRADDRLRPGRQRQHRRVRPARARSPMRRTRPVPGSTSTERSGCGPTRVLDSAISWPGSTAPTRGRPTRTSG